MKKIFALVVFAITTLCSTDVLAMDKKRTHSEAEQNTPLAQRQNTPDAPRRQRTKANEVDWNAEPIQYLFPASEEEPDYTGVLPNENEANIAYAELMDVPAADNNDEFEEAFAAINNN